eukprot:SAG11_NODE_993_length_6261_cov_114.016391_2_plen_83_part_00
MSMTAPCSFKHSEFQKGHAVGSTFEYEQMFFNNIVSQSHLDKPLTTLGMISYISLPVSRALLFTGDEMGSLLPYTIVGHSHL